MADNADIELIVTAEVDPASATGIEKTIGKAVEEGVAGGLERGMKRGSGSRVPLDEKVALENVRHQNRIELEGVRAANRERLAGIAAMGRSLAKELRLMLYPLGRNDALDTLPDATRQAYKESADTRTFSRISSGTSSTLLENTRVSRDIAKGAQTVSAQGEQARNEAELAAELLASRYSQAGKFAEQDAAAEQLAAKAAAEKARAEELLTFEIMKRQKAEQEATIAAAHAASRAAKDSSEAYANDRAQQERDYNRLIEQRASAEDASFAKNWAAYQAEERAAIEARTKAEEMAAAEAAKTADAQHKQRQQELDSTFGISDSFRAKSLRASKIGNDPAAAMVADSQNRLSAMSRQVGNPFMVLSEISGAVSGTRRIRDEIARTTKTFDDANRKVKQYRDLLKSATTEAERASARAGLREARGERREAGGAMGAAMSQGSGPGFMARAGFDFMAQNVIAGGLFGIVFPISQEIATAVTSAFGQVARDLIDPTARAKEEAASAATAFNTLADAIRGAGSGSALSNLLGITGSLRDLINQVGSFSATSSQIETYGSAVQAAVFQSRGYDAGAVIAQDQVDKLAAQLMGAFVNENGSLKAGVSSGNADSLARKALSDAGASPEAVQAFGMGYYQQIPEPFLLGQMRNQSAQEGLDTGFKRAARQMIMDQQPRMIAAGAVGSMKLGERELFLSQEQLNAIEKIGGAEAKNLALRARSAGLNETEIERLRALVGIKLEGIDAEKRALELAQQRAAIEKAFANERVRYVQDQISQLATFRRTQDFNMSRSSWMGSLLNASSLPPEIREMAAQSGGSSGIKGLTTEFSSSLWKLTASQKKQIQIQKEIDKAKGDQLRLQKEQTKKQNDLALAQGKADIKRAGIALPGQTGFEVSAAILEAKERYRELVAQQQAQQKMADSATAMSNLSEQLAALVAGENAGRAQQDEKLAALLDAANRSASEKFEVKVYIDGVAREAAMIVSQAMGKSDRYETPFRVPGSNKPVHL